MDGPYRGEPRPAPPMSVNPTPRSVPTETFAGILPGDRFNYDGAEITVEGFHVNDFGVCKVRFVASGDVHAGTMPGNMPELELEEVLGMIRGATWRRVVR